jgi:hypothetical protein
MRRRLFVAILGCVVPWTGAWASPEPLAVRVVSELGPRSSTLTVSIPEGSTRAVAVFSEPSHTLLAVVTDNSDGRNPVDSDWYRKEVGPTVNSPRLMSLPLRDGAAGRIHTVGKIEGDEEIGLSILGDGSDPMATYTGRVRAAWPFDFTVRFGE